MRSVPENRFSPKRKAVLCGKSHHRAGASELRTASLFFIAFSVACAGYLYSKRLEARVKKTEKILLLLSQIKTEIEFTAASVEDIFNSLLSSGDYSSLPFIDICRKAMQNGDDFGTAWSKSLNKTESTYALKKEDVNLLFSFGSALGTTDSSGQIRNCEMHEKLFRERLNSAEAECEKLSKPARITGILAGAAAVIIFM